MFLFMSLHNLTFSCICGEADSLTGMLSGIGCHSVAPACFERTEAGERVGRGRVGGGGGWERAARALFGFRIARGAR